MIELWNHQKKSVFEVFEHWREGKKSVLLQSVTGSGKTVMFNHITKLCVDKGYRVLIIADRKELIMQAWQKLWSAYGIHAGIVMAGHAPAYQIPVQIASIQTLNRRNFPPNIDLVILDECRGSVSDQYKDVWNFYRGSRFLGVDATPIRTNGQGFDHLYDALVLGPSVKDMEQVWRENNRSGLVPARIFSTPFSPAELAKIKMTAGDYNERDLAQMMIGGTHSADIVQSWLKDANGLKTMCFAVNIEHSKQIREQFQAAGISAAHVDGESPDRDKIFADFKAGKYRILVNVGIATYGYDEPTIEAVLLARPTKSLALYLQMVGRGTRPNPGKMCYVLLDCANCIVEHGLPNQNRTWSLKDTRKQKNKKYIVKQDGKPARIVAGRDLPQGIKGMHLEEVTEQGLRNVAFDKILKTRNEKGYQPLWCFFEFLKKHPDMNLQDLQYMAEKLNFKPGWANVKFKEIEDRRKALNTSTP